MIKLDLIVTSKSDARRLLDAHPRTSSPRTCMYTESQVVLFDKFQC